MPITKPVTLPRFGADTSGNVATSTNTPPSGLQDTGWAPGDRPAAEHLTWLFAWIYIWIRWLNDITNQAFTWAAQHIFSLGVKLNGGTSSLESGATFDFKAGSIVQFHSAPVYSAGLEIGAGQTLVIQNTAKIELQGTGDVTFQNPRTGWVHLRGTRNNWSWGGDTAGTMLGTEGYYVDGANAYIKNKGNGGFYSSQPRLPAGAVITEIAMLVTNTHATIDGGVRLSLSRYLNATGAYTANLASANTTTTIPANTGPVWYSEDVTGIASSNRTVSSNGMLVANMSFFPGVSQGDDKLLFHAMRITFSVPSAIPNHT